MSDTPKIPDAVDIRRLAAMRQVAIMKEKADQTGSGFIGGFIDDDGQMFVMTNIEDPVTKEKPSDRQLRQWMQGFQDGMNSLEGRA